MDKQRDAALAGLREEAESGTRQSERLAAYLAKIGSEVVDSSPLPNSITAIVDSSKLAALAKRSDVFAIIPAPKTSPQSSPLDGSEIWHTNGFTGGGSSLDGNGGPDYGVFDQGVRVSHDAFKTRLPGDCATCMGSGPTRIVSPAGRTDFGGSQHGNVVAATVAGTDLQIVGPAQPKKGLAYGIDNVYDEYEANSPIRWLIGITYQGEPGVTDLPETINYSAGLIENTTDMNSAWAGIDALVANTGINWTISAGNCGIATFSYQGCGTGPHRVETPGNLPNAITMGGMDEMSSTDPLDWEVWANSSAGPTWGGRKKPDLISTVFSGAGGPDSFNDTGYSNPGTGTSYAAPKAAAGTLLLSSVGVYTPTAQKAILINSAHPIDGQTYWHPRSGWGGLNLEDAFYQRANYMNGSVTPAGANGTRFYKQTGVAAGDRTTLVWNRRVGAYTGNNSPAYSTMTNLDLIQIAESDTCSPNCTPTATGGSDAADTVDTDQTVTVDNPMPGSGSDGEDNVEQVRSTGTGNQIFKVRAMSTIDGAASEQFSIAGTNAIQALQTPIPTVDLDADLTVAGPGDDIEVTATITNPSSQLALTGADVTLTLPSGTALVSGTLTQSVGTLNASASTTRSWTIDGSTHGTKNLSATTTGTTYGEAFSGTGSTDFVVDATPPTLSIDPQPTWSGSNPASFSWSATDADSSVATYDAEVSIDGGAFTSVLSGSTSTSTAVAAAEGQTIELRVRVRDVYANLSDWQCVTTTIDAIAPTIAIGAATTPSRGTINVPATISNVGSPVTATYTFGPAGSATRTFASPATFTNASATTITARLTITATDALGRVTTNVSDHLVGPRFLSSNARISSVKVKRRTARISGTTATGYSGTVTIAIRRIGKKGTKRVSRKFKARSGRYNAKIKLKPGKYQLTATTTPTDDFFASKSTKKFVVR